MLEPRFYLQQLLERNELIGRDVIITEDKLEQNCGDLVAYRKETRHQHCCNQRKGYWLTPDNAASAIQNCKHLPAPSPRMVAVSATLSQTTYPHWFAAIRVWSSNGNHPAIVKGLLIGLAFGFLLSLEEKLEHHAGSLAGLVVALRWVGF